MRSWIDGPLSPDKDVPITIDTLPDQVDSTLQGSIPRGLLRQKMVFEPDTSQLATGSGLISGPALWRPGLWRITRKRGSR
jgi:hypothetical protein